MLDSGQAWSAKTWDKNQWLSIDVGKTVEIVGVIMQGRGFSCKG
jgi:hypothetical protein